MLARRQVIIGLGALPIVLLGGCGGSEEPLIAHQPAPIMDGDECHVCGMIINNFPGPKGEAYVRNSVEVLKFCSTRDLFAFLIQPETTAVVQEIYVHDMGKTSWDKPSDDFFTDARSAAYVICHPLRGAMGATLASYQAQTDAEQFAAQHNGKILRFDDIEADLIGRLNDTC